ncbi:MAG: DUF6788 family protein [Candidatus Caldatribacteriota bacterium]|nr:DUF6788 family protein [Candidatus Caldatribacteriota bacterium]
MKKEKQRLNQIEIRIKEIKNQLFKLGSMRPGSLTKQYRLPKELRGAYYQLSYTHEMKSRTDYIRPEFIENIRKEIDSYKIYRELTSEWTKLGIEHSKLRMKISIQTEKVTRERK